VLDGVEHKEDPAGITPSIGSSNQRPQLPQAGAADSFFDTRMSKIDHP